MLLLLVACASSVKVGGDSGGPPPPGVDVEGPAAVDPLLGEATFSLAYTGGDALTVEVRDPSGAVVRTLVAGAPAETATWDGRDEAGTIVPRGEYVVHVALADAGEPVAEDELATRVVRVGILSGTLGGDRIPLTWHADGDYQDGGLGTTFAIEAIDNGEVATPLPEVWDDLWELPDDVTVTSIPAAYAWNARPTLSLVVGGDVGTAALIPAIDGWTLTSGEVAPGATLVFTKDEALATGPGVLEDGLVLRWLAGGHVVGEQAVPLRIYALLGAPAFEREGVEYQPWLAVIDPALRSMAGVEPTAAAVTSALVTHIYRNLDLAYDTAWGASAYTQYAGNTFDYAHFDLTGFLARARGSIVNCTDCASILEAFANMLGAPLSYTIITPGFNLNLIQAIGSDHYTQCPFDRGGCGFSYHAVTTPDDGDTIYDATLALDGDIDPSALPATELLVQAIAGEEYLDRLVESGRTGYRYTQKATLQ